MIDLQEAPEKVFTGPIFFQNDWNWGDRDNINVGEELNRNSRIKDGLIILTQIPGRNPGKVSVDGVVDEAKPLAEASQRGKVAFAMGGASQHAWAWLTALPQSEYNYSNIILVTHSNYNESDGAIWSDTHGEDLPRSDYPVLAKISDLGVTIWELPRTDHGAGGWGGRVVKFDGKIAAIKYYDISDLGLVGYLRTGILNPDRLQRNEFVSEEQQKPATLSEVESSRILRYWEVGEGAKNHNRNLPGERADYMEGGKYSETIR
ncbi:MAG: hypothetical protein ACON4O_06985 [Lentimonas sp.]